MSTLTIGLILLALGLWLLRKRAERRRSAEQVRLRLGRIARRAEGTSARRVFHPELPAAEVIRLGRGRPARH